MDGRKLPRYQAIRDSVIAIVASESVEQFCVGITGKKTARKASYSNWCKKNNGQLMGFVILDWNHSPESAVELEEWLFHAVKDHKKYANTGFVKYFPNVNRKFSEHDVYIAWWSPAFSFDNLVEQDE
jgi:hypothetical protein